MHQDLDTAPGGPYFWRAQQATYRRPDGAIFHFGTKLGLAYDAADRTLMLHGTADAVRSGFVAACANAIKFAGGKDIVADWRLLIFDASLQTITGLNAVIEGAMSRVGFDIEGALADHMPTDITEISGVSLMANIVSEQMAPAVQ
jgi:hypothetical protein